MSDLHFVRLRRKDSTDSFLDPEADVKSIMPRALAYVEKVLAKHYPADDVQHIHNCVKVLETRLLEDPTPLKEQVDLFCYAMMGVAEMEADLFHYLGKYFFYSWLLHMRRDGQADNRVPMFAEECLLSKDNAEDLKQAEEILGKDKIKPVEADAACVETGEVIRDIKDEVGYSIGADKDMTWDQLADACDKYVEFGEGDEKQLIAASLAYPTYSKPYFELIVEDEKSN